MTFPTTPLGVPVRVLVPLMQDLAPRAGRQDQSPTTGPVSVKSPYWRHNRLRSWLDRGPSHNPSLPPPVALPTGPADSPSPRYTLWQEAARLSATTSGLRKVARAVVPRLALAGGPPVAARLLHPARRLRSRVRCLPACAWECPSSRQSAW